MKVLLLLATKDYDVIQVDYAICKVQFPQGILHEMLECHGCIAQTERHVGKLIEPEVTHQKGCVLLGSWGHLDLPKASFEVH